MAGCREAKIYSRRRARQTSCESVPRPAPRSQLFWGLSWGAAGGGLWHHFDVEAKPSASKRVGNPHQGLELGLANNRSPILQCCCAAAMSVDLRWGRSDVQPVLVARAGVPGDWGVAHGAPLVS